MCNVSQWTYVAQLALHSAVAAQLPSVHVPGSVHVYPFAAVIAQVIPESTLDPLTQAAGLHDSTPLAMVATVH